MDRARSKTNKLLKDLERRVGEVYITDPSLSYIQRKYHDYMNMVKMYTKDSYEAYVNETDIDTKEQLKKVYTNEVRALTVKSVEYRRLINEIAVIMANINQKALDLINNEMTEVYTINYNQVAVECKKVGITVNGETKI